MKRAFFLCLLVLGLICSATTRVEAVRATSDDKKQDGNSSNQAVLISIPGLSFLEWEPGVRERMPHLKRLLESGSIGAMNIRTNGRKMDDVYATLGAGVTAEGLARVQAFNTAESWYGITSRELYDRYSGRVEGHAAVLIPQVEVWKQYNLQKDEEAKVGFLGEKLRRMQISRVVLGNSDLGLPGGDEKKLRRFAAYMLADAEGTIQGGNVGADTLVSAADRPYGVKTDYSRLLERWRDGQSNELGAGAAKVGSVVLFELGDLYRLEADSGSYSRERFWQLKTRILEEMDIFIGNVLAGLGSKNALWIFSPEVGEEALQDRLLLAPVVFYREGAVPGLLRSETTRRVGIVAQTDLTASVLHEFQVSASLTAAGMVMKTVPNEAGLSWLLQEMKRVSAVYRARPLLLYPFVTYEVIVLLVSLVFAVISGFRPVSNKDRDAGKQWGGKLCQISLASILAAPLTMLVMGLVTELLAPGLSADALVRLLICCFIGGILVVSLSLSRFRALNVLCVLSWLTAGGILLDGFTGSRAMKHSVLGYDPMIGARYYGIGNEYMGVLIGALVLAVTVSLQRSSKVRKAAAPVCAAFGLATVYLAAPSLGTNAGGALSAAVAFGFAAVRCFGGSGMRELNGGRVATLLAAALAAGLLALWLLNSAIPPAVAGRESHIGRAFHVLREGRFDQIGHLIERKLRMNAHLIRVSAWSKALLASLFVMAVLVLRPRGQLGRWQHKYPYLMYGFSANTFGAIAALLLNDSGIVAAATMIVYVAVPLLLMQLQERSASHSS